MNKSNLEVVELEGKPYDVRVLISIYRSPIKAGNSSDLQRYYDFDRFDTNYLIDVTKFPKSTVK